MLLYIVGRIVLIINTIIRFTIMQLVTVLLYEVYYFADDPPNLAALSIFGAAKRI